MTTTHIMLSIIILIQIAILTQTYKINYIMKISRQTKWFIKFIVDKYNTSKDDDKSIVSIPDPTPDPTPNWLK